jgi:hypothetical protein
MAKNNERDADRKPIVNTLSIGLKQGLSTKLEAKGMVARLVGLLKRRRRSRQDPITAVIIEKWGPNWPPDTLPTPEALRMLRDECKGIIASDDSFKRAMGRR